MTASDYHDNVLERKMSLLYNMEKCKLLYPPTQQGFGGYSDQYGVRP